MRALGPNWYLLFDTSGDELEFISAIMVNDSSPGNELFTQDILNRLSINNDSDNRAHKPHLMFEDILYGVSVPPSQTGIYYSLDIENPQHMGTVESVINGMELPQKNKQVNGYDHLLDCGLYMTDIYPKHLFVLDNEGNYIAFAND